MKSFLDHLPYHEIWCVDFEFQAHAGERQDPVCLVAREQRSGRIIRLWKNELKLMSNPPYSIESDTLFVSYFASAELGCHEALGWPMPQRILDLFTEFRALTNGLPPHSGYSLLGALAHHGISSIATAQKDIMRDKILSGGPWTDMEQSQILDYCQTDVEALSCLLPIMTPRIDLPRALYRGRYMAAVARMEWTGIPIDTEILNELTEYWGDIKAALVAEVDRHFHVYEGLVFKMDRFRDYVLRNKIPWPLLESGKLDLSDKAFKERAGAFSEIEPLRQCRKTLSQLRLNKLAVGRDGRNRCLLSPFGTRTGRNSPSNSKLIFGAAAWLRSLIRPEAGRSLAYIDWSAQEIGIAAALSEDPLLMSGYKTGDPYLAFGKQAGVIPKGATKQSHKADRDRLKAVVLGTNYGMGPESIAAQVGISSLEARQLLNLHRMTYKRFWQWADENVARVDLNGVIATVYGWPIYTGRDWNPRAALNFPMQANGAEIMRIAAMLATEAGVNVCAPVHDAFLIEADEIEIHDTVAQMQAIMAQASRQVLNGFEIRTDVELIDYPNRYVDERGTTMWNTALLQLEQIKKEARI